MPGVIDDDWSDLADEIGGQVQDSQTVPQEDSDVRELMDAVARLGAAALKPKRPAPPATPSPGPAPVVRMPAPQVHVAAPVVHVAAPEVNVPAPVVNVEAQPSRAWRFTLNRDRSGLIQSIDATPITK